MVVMQVFVSLLLVGGSLVLFLHFVRQRDFDHADRLSLAPLEEDDQTGTLEGSLEPPATTPLGKAQLRQRDDKPQPKDDKSS
jgi:hypothetical protein